MIPKYLYHYTSIDTLKLIIENNTIKFSRLDLMNDPHEGKITIDEKSETLGTRKKVYCSSWSEEAEESISMWGVYSRFKGVRIKARSDLFADFNGLQECDGGFAPYGFIEPIASGIKATTDGREIMIRKILGPVRMEYVALDKLQGCVAKPGHFWKLDEPQVSINFADVGNQKSMYWEYEKEWRFKLSAFSYEGIRTSKMVDDSTETDEHYLKEIFVPIKRNIEEIIMGPDTTDEQYRDIVSYVASKGKDIQVKKSSIAFQNLKKGEA